MHAGRKTLVIEPVTLHTMPPAVPVTLEQPRKHSANNKLDGKQRALVLLLMQCNR